MKNKVLVTGGFGFIGSHLCDYLYDKGLEVICFDRYNSEQDIGNLKYSKHINKFEIIFGDVRDFDSVNDSISKVDTVFHLAALIGIPYSYKSPLAYIRTNIEGTYNILESCKSNNIKNLVLTSTSETYGSAQFVPMNESHPVNAQSPYAATKIAADNLAMSYFNSYNLNLKIARPFNTYGPRQSSRAVIPTIIKQAIKTKKIKLGSTYPTRDLTYVHDTCSGFYEIFKSNKLNGKIINIGMNQETSILDLVNKISNLLKYKTKIISENKRKRPAKSEVKRLLCDNSLLIKKTNWKPKYNLSKGLSKTITWFKKNKKNFETKDYAI